jgi:hypothetical protein
MKHTLFAACALAMLMLHPVQASATAITITQADIGEGFSVIALGAGSEDGLPVSARFDAIITDYDIDFVSMLTTLTLDVTLTNTTSLLVDSSLRGYGFASNPDVMSGTTSGTAFNFDTVTTGVNGNNSTGNVETCVADAIEPQCTGMQDGGLESGQVDTHTLSLVFDGVFNSLSLGDPTAGMFFRFLSVEDLNGQREDSAKVFGNPPLFPTPTNVTPVPEPSALLLFGTGLALAARKVRQRFVQ